MSSSANRSIVDAENQVTLALPAAAANANSAAIDLGEHPDQLENVELELAVDLTATLVDTKDIDIKLQDSADGSSFADIGEFADPVLKVTGVSGNGNAETKLQVRLPRSVRRYVRMNVAVETAGGANTGSNSHLRLVF